MISEFHHGKPAPCPTPFNMAAHVLRHGHVTPDKTALELLGTDGSECWSYARLTQAILGTGTGLLRAGYRPGDRLLMRLGNDVEFPIAYLGAIAVGLIPVPTSTQLTEPEVAEIIRVIKPAAILQSPGISCPQTDIPVLSEPELHAMHSLPAARFNMGDPERQAYIIFTSGTSGRPRAVAHAHRAVWARQLMVEGWYGLREEDRLMHAGAFNWSYTLGTGMMDPWAIGATALIPAPGTDLHDLPGLMQRHRASIFAAAPGVYRKFLRPDVQLDLPALRHGLSAGEKLSDNIRQDWNAATGTMIYEAYGMSECSTFISGSPAHPAPPGTLGYPQKGRHVAIMDANGPVPLGEAGILAIHRSDPGLMLGYLDAPDETAARMHQEWFLTGDQGVMDTDGAITYLGRADDMMNAGGYRVSPLEVEAVLNTFPGISQSAATDIEVKTDARVIVAFYTGPKPLATDLLEAHMKTKLARYKCPRLYYHVEALPTGPNGKILRRALRPIYQRLNDET
jgi:acyl-coenzyme A synthetase/AMP-(fatty) acid ligase